MLTLATLLSQLTSLEASLLGLCARTEEEEAKAHRPACNADAESARQARKTKAPSRGSLPKRNESAAGI